MIDNELYEFFKQESTFHEPYINEAKIISESARRKKRKIIIWLSAASVLWLVCFLVSAILLGTVNQTFSLLLFIFAGIQLIASGLLCIAILKRRVV